MKYPNLITRLFLLLFIITLFSSCASSYITSVVKSENERPYSSIMLVFTNGKSFKGLSNENYDHFVDNSFNDVSNLKFRQQLEKSLARNMTSNGFPKIVKSSDVFTVDEAYTYDEFLAKVKRTGCEAILLVNLDDYWMTSNYETTFYDNSALTREREEPNSSYNVLLYDVNDFIHYKWISEVTVEGIYAGFDTLNNHFSRRVANKLRKANFIH